MNRCLFLDRDGVINAAPMASHIVREAMKAYRELPIALDPDGSKIIFQNRTGYRMGGI